MSHAVSPARRDRLLKVMGVTPWRLRAGGAGEGVAGAAVNDATAGDRVPCVVVLPAGATEREHELVGRALRAFGPVMGRAARLEAGERGLGHVPIAAHYLVFGEAQARALGHELPAAAMAAAQIVLVDTPAALLASAAAKRRLWNGLRALGRSLGRG
jgi:DNA polymerase III psi subunit